MAELKLTEKTVTAIPSTSGDARTYHWDTEVRGFGVVVSRTSRSFVVRGRVKGSPELLKITIGQMGATNENGLPWSVILARQEARAILGKLASGIDPRGERKARATGRVTGPTLRDGLTLHIANMRKRGCSERSIDTIEGEVPRLLDAWLDRSIADLTGADLARLHDQFTNDGKPYMANRIVAQVSAVWNALDRVHELAGRNPARAVTRNRYTPSRVRVADHGMASWFEKVQTLSPVRRDLQLFCLFTGMRSEAARHVRWEHIDEERGALVVPKPKGGEAKAFTLPLPPSVIAMLVKRRRENRDAVGPYGGDHGWVFPSLSRARDDDGQFTVQPIAEPKEYKVDPATKRKVSILPGLHTLRRTYLSVAAEAGVSELDRHVLANHAFGRQNVNATYIEQAFDHLAECQAKVEAALWQRLKPKPTTKARGKLRAV